MNESNLLKGSCLCGDITYQSTQIHNEMWNCHCHACRKSNSIAYATWIKAQDSSFEWLEKKSAITRHYSSPTMSRTFCSKCGSILPAHIEKENYRLLPAGGISTPHNLTPSEDRYADQIPPWYNICGHHHNEQTQRSGHSEQILNHNNLNGTVQGSCLCGSINYTVTGEMDAIRGCHCSRCRRRSGGGFFTGMPMVFSDFQVQDHGKNIKEFKLPESQFYSYRFCGICATLIPMIFPGGNRTVIAAGTIDSLLPVQLMFHIFCASKAPWLNFNPNDVCFNEYPPSDYDWRRNS